MLFRLSWVAVLATAVMAQLQVDTPPSLIQCQPVQLSWSGGTGPYFLAILPGGQSEAAALENLPNADNSPATWLVNIASGTNVTIRVTDSTGQQQYSFPRTILAGTSSECLGSDASVSVGGTTSASATGGGSDGSSSPTASATSGSGSPTSSSGSGASAASSAAAQTSGAALPGTQVTGIMFTVVGLLTAAFGVTV
ncbi:hypothetical protein BD324DRAFT_615596 [Kockovaella imperatae]|uniref:Ser-Thr-rich glycosyl-phosphatidyl-inositol-anchored membrane family-domain-containing protein n=1 Tax=Kockovaella imperatae TaxID=4999 RepID=A0A1Y1UPQ0_9TREE|nr:hypothetical protein BD324DRAFT_615596 [Kockovaella imperatae]ORX39942.1 hypothetical protein BD324DRAFT_615596 [Kockovaella imperatae]